MDAAPPSSQAKGTVRGQMCFLYTVLRCLQRYCGCRVGWRFWLAWPAQDEEEVERQGCQGPLEAPFSCRVLWERYLCFPWPRAQAAASAHLWLGSFEVMLSSHSSFS